MAVNWAELPDEILDEMATRVHSVGDFVRFGGVCRYWRSVAVAKKPLDYPSWGPWLMLPEKHKEKYRYVVTAVDVEELVKEENIDAIQTQEEEEEEEEEDLQEEEEVQEEEEYVDPSEVEEEEEEEDDMVRRFYDISTKQIFGFQLPQAKGRRCWGSPLGWLLTFGIDHNIHLLNPLTHHQIRLPPQQAFQYDDQARLLRSPRNTRGAFIEKFALSSHPIHPHCVVMVIFEFTSSLAFTTPGDKCWTTVKRCTGQGYDDIIFFNHLFYAVNGVGSLYFCDVTKPEPEEIPYIMTPPMDCPDPYVYSRFYLVEICGDLCMVVRLYRDARRPLPAYQQITAVFEAFRLDFSTKSWIRLHSLGDYALFLGTNTSFAVSTSEQPQFKSNAIYFTDDYAEGYFRPWGGTDIGLYDFKEKKLCHRFYSGNDTNSKFCPPLFFTPNLH